jgi:sister chromatid cohesion protein DCC1
VVDALAGEHEVPRGVSTQVLGWFGEVMREGVGGGRWKMDVQSVVREVGLGILRNYKVRGLEVRWVRVLHLVEYYMCRTTRYLKTSS